MSLRPRVWVRMLAATCAIAACERGKEATQQPQGPGTPAPRALASAERDSLLRGFQQRFRQAAPAGAQYGAAGPFHVLRSDQIAYLVRTDVGSVVYERGDYGAAGGGRAFDTTALPRAALLTRIGAQVSGMGFDTSGQRFVAFQDEYAGAAPRSAGKTQVDPRRVARLVARTAAFERTIGTLPIFGSELLVGLMPDGSVGRFRRHWPAIEPKLIEQAHDLERAVASRSWVIPAELRSPDITILETTAGVAHSGIADPGFRAAAVVRVTYRRTSRAEPPLSSTSYKYFDRSGQEVSINIFPKLPETPAQQKPAVGKQ